MAKLDPNTLIGILRGKLGDLTFVPAPDGTVIVKRLPVRNAEFTEGELANQSQFTQAAAYVKSAHQQPEIYAAYQAEARLKGKRACDLAHADFRHRPGIQDVDLTEYHGSIAEPIRIQTADDFGVVAVRVTLTQLDGVLLEHGEAQPGEAAPETWIYAGQSAIAPGQTIVVHVTATDRPGNAGTKTIHHALIPG